MTTRRTRTVAALIAAGLAAACAGAPPGENAAYRVGWVYGCESGFSDEGRAGYFSRRYQNEQRYAAEADYRKGWDVAYASCSEEQRLRPVVRDRY